MSNQPPYKRTIWSQSLDAAGILSAIQRNALIGAVPVAGETLLNWQCSPQDMQLIEAIVSRGLDIWAGQGIQLDRGLALMDVTCCHCNGCPLELMQWLMSDATDFANDFAGIGVHIDKKSGKLLHDYKPRFRKVLQ